MTVLTIADILNAPVDSPTHEECPECHGSASPRSPSWERFVQRHGSAEAFGRCQRAADQARTSAGVARYETLWKPSVDQLVQAGLTTEMASDYVELILNQPTVVRCTKCENGLVLTEFGRALQQLKAAFARV